MKTDWKRTFAVLWTGQLFSILSSGLVGFALIIWMSIETESAEVLAYAAIAALLPQSVLGLFAGVFIDRWDRKKTMIYADLFIAACTMVISLLFYFDTVELWYIYLLLALRSTGSAFHMPAMQASVPLLAPESELVRIAGVNQAILSVSTIAGPVLGALLISLMDISYVLLFDVAGAVLGIVSLLLVKIPNPEQDKEKEKGMAQVWQEVKEGVWEVTRQKGLKLLFFFSIMVTFCIMPLSVLFPLMTLKHFNGNEFQISIVEMAWGVGMLVGGVLLGIFRMRYHKVKAINLTYVIIGAALAASGILPVNGFLLFVVLTAIEGLFFALYNSCFTAIIQERVDAAKLGRVFSMFMSASVLPSMLGLLSTGFLADYIGITHTFVILGSAIVLIGIVSFFIPEIIKLGYPKAIHPEQESS